MEAKVLDFYKENFGGLPKMIEVGQKKKGLSPAHVCKAAELAFYRHKYNPYPNKLVLGLQVYAMAKSIDLTGGFKHLRPLSFWKRFFYSFDSVWSL